MNQKVKRLTYLTIFVALEILFSVVPFLGYIPLGFINATTLHIPVILSSLILGYKEGAFLGFVFGFSSLLKNTFEPNATSFLFSPFFSLGETSGNFLSLVIVFVPRIFLGLWPHFVMGHLKNKYRGLTACFSATFLHTVLVMGLAYLFFAKSYALALGVGADMIVYVILGVVFTSGLAESVIAAIICPLIYRVFEKRRILL